MKVKLILDVGVPAPEVTKGATPKKTIEEKVKDLVDLVETEYAGRTEWLTLAKLHKDLLEKKQKMEESGRKCHRVDNLLDMIQPLMSKYGYHAVPTQPQRSGEKK